MKHKANTEYTNSLLQRSGGKNVTKVLIGKSPTECYVCISGKRSYTCSPRGLPTNKMLIVPRGPAWERFKVSNGGVV